MTRATDRSGLATLALAAALLAGCDDTIDVRRAFPTDRCTAGATRPCYGGPPETRAVGACRDGVEACGADGRWSGDCRGETRPAPRDPCDYVDNDCDGEVDESFVYEETAETRVVRSDPLPVSGVVAARHGAVAALAWTSGIGEDTWTERLRVEIVDLPFGRTRATNVLSHLAPSTLRALHVREEGGGSFLVQLGMEDYALCGARPGSRGPCGEQFVAFDLDARWRFDADRPPSSEYLRHRRFVALEGTRARPTVDVDDRLLFAERVEPQALVVLRALDPTTLDPLPVEGGARIVELPFAEEVDRASVRGVVRDGVVYWVASHGGALDVLATDAHGRVLAGPTSVAVLSGAAVRLDDLVVVDDTLAALVDSAAGAFLVRWRPRDPSPPALTPLGPSGIGRLSYAPDAGQTYVCLVAAGAASIQRVSLRGRLMPYPRPAASRIDADTTCQPVASPRGALAVTRVHHDGVITWAHFGCPGGGPPG